MRLRSRLSVHDMRPASAFAPGALFAADLKTNRYRLLGANTGNILALPGAAFSRSGPTAYARNAAGVWVPFAANVPRITDTGYLAEEAATNVSAGSDNLTGTGWSSTAVANTSIKWIDGVNWVTLTDNNSGATVSRIFTATCPNDSTSWTASLFVKKDAAATAMAQLQLRFTGGTTPLDYRAIFDPRTGAIGGFSPSGSAADAKPVVKDFGDHFRIELTGANNNSGNTSIVVAILPATNALGGASTSQSSAHVGTIHVAGFQLENKPYATSYIPTSSTATATRGADALSITGLGSILTPPFTMVVHADLSAIDGVLRNLLSASADASVSNYLLLRRDAGNLFNSVSRVAGSDVGFNSLAGASGAFIARMALRVRSGSMQMSANGTLAASSAPALPTVSQLYFGIRPNASNSLNSPLTFAAIYGDVDDATLQRLTQ